MAADLGEIIKLCHGLSSDKVTERKVITALKASLYLQLILCILLNFHSFLSIVDNFIMRY